MQSWRDALTPAAQAELDRLLDSGLRVVRQNLASASEFDPFGLFIDAEGRIIAVMHDPATGGHPEAETIAATATSELRKVADAARCSAVILTSRLSRERTDAVEIRLEHREGIALLVLLPYKRASIGGRVDYEELKVFAGKREVWD